MGQSPIIWHYIPDYYGFAYNTILSYNNIWDAAQSGNLYLIHIFLKAYVLDINRFKIRNKIKFQNLIKIAIRNNHYEIVKRLIPYYHHDYRNRSLIEFYTTYINNIGLRMDNLIYEALVSYTGPEVLELLISQPWYKYRKYNRGWLGGIPRTRNILRTVATQFNNDILMKDILSADNGYILTDNNNNISITR